MEDVRKAEESEEIVSGGVDGGNEEEGQGTSYKDEGGAEETKEEVGVDSKGMDDVRKAAESEETA